MKTVIDATDLIVGRLASYVAKQAILGEEFVIVNSDKAIITGNRKQIMAKYRHLREMGTPTQGPFFPRRAKEILKRVIKGMVPYKQYKGKEALRRVKCFNGVPTGLKEKPTTLESANVSKIPNTKFVTLKDVAEFLGGKFKAERGATKK
ncbi:MAG: 50S ribosomal protein L13 [archaeon]